MTSCHSDQAVTHGAGGHGARSEPAPRLRRPRDRISGRGTADAGTERVHGGGGLSAGQGTEACLKLTLGVAGSHGETERNSAAGSGGSAPIRALLRATRPGREGHRPRPRLLSARCLTNLVCVHVPISVVPCPFVRTGTESRHGPPEARRRDGVTEEGHARRAGRQRAVLRFLRPDLPFTLSLVENSQNVPAVQQATLRPSRGRQNNVCFLTPRPVAVTSVATGSPGPDGTKAAHQLALWSREDPGPCRRPKGRAGSLKVGTEAGGQSESAAGGEEGPPDIWPETEGPSRGLRRPLPARTRTSLVHSRGNTVLRMPGL